MIPAVLGIDEALENCETRLGCLKNALRHGLTDRFQNIIVKPHYIVATVLDCRFKIVPFIDDRLEIQNDAAYSIQAVTRSQARAHLLNMMTTFSHSQSSVTENTSLNEQPAVQNADNVKSSIFSKFSQPVRSLMTLKTTSTACLQRNMK